MVDDGSPVPATGEAKTLAFAAPYHLTIINQLNSGVSAARNAALRSVPEQTVYIAFLDSDDYWHPDHLYDAITALDHGCDFYFCDAQRIGQPETVFSDKSFSNFITKHGTDLGEKFHELDNGPFFNNALLICPCVLSAAVYRRAIAPELMFDISLRVAGEDCLFFLELARQVQPRLLLDAAAGDAR